MARPTNTVNTRLISKISTLYYHFDLTQQEIADRLRISRPKVSRLLKQAKELNIVQVSVNAPDSAFLNLENLLENKFRLKEVIITEIDLHDDSQSESILKRQLGIAAANYLLRSVSEGDVIGVTWGTTLQEMVDMLQPKPIKNVHVVQTLGGVGPPEAKAHATDISRRLSQLLDSRLTLLPAPAIVDSAEAKKVLLADRRVKAALDLFAKINIAYVGIGGLTTNPLLRKENLEIPGLVKNDILNLNAVGDIGLNFFDIEGKKINSEFKKLFIGISLEELKKVDIVIGIAGGKGKFEAILGALRGGYINVLITDQITAEKLASSDAG
jgi:deoxyribonucleoside regulator